MKQMLFQFQVLCPSILVTFHFMVLKMKGREPTREAALKRQAEAYDTYLEQQNTIAMSMSNTAAATTSKKLWILF